MGIEIRNSLLKKGYFPEVLPPCFDSEDIIRCFKGIQNEIENRKFRKRYSNYIRYNGTKHDGNRRLYGTVHPIPYFNACSFISKNWRTFQNKMFSSSLTLTSLRLGREDEDRAIVVPTLSELTDKISAQIRYAPIILKADIAQFFPSIYTHTISWVAHGRKKSKLNQKHNSPVAKFNRLDWFTQQCQNGQTRGVVVGPDVFRIISEYIISDIDQKLSKEIGDILIGGVRHVDDFYIGVRNESDAIIVLSKLRDILQSYELQINDSKTKILSGLDSIDDIWAQELRSLRWQWHPDFKFALDKAHDIAKAIHSQSPMKLILRRFDGAKCYKHNLWNEIEPMLQRVLYHYNHCSDYVCLLLAKRVAIDESIDEKGWEEAIADIIDKHIAFNHHHEIAWLLWLTFVCKLNLPNQLIQKLRSVQNSHIKALLIIACVEGNLKRKPPIKLGNSLSTTDENWLLNLIGKSSGYTKANFSGDFSEEFEHLSKNHLELINFEKHIIAVSEAETEAISSSKYGYDAEDDEVFENFLDNDDD